MSNRQLGLRSALICCIIGIIGLAVSVAVAAAEGGFPLAFGTPGGVQTGSGEPSAVGVVTTLHHLALANDYTDDQMEAFGDLIERLIDGGVPPGILLQVSKKLLSERDPDAFLSMLEQLGQDIAAGTPPGQAANAILEKGGGNGNGNTGDNAGGGNGNGNTGDNAGGGNGNGNTGNNAGGGNGNGNTGDNAGGGNGKKK